MCESFTPEDWGFGNGGQLDVVVWTGEVQETKTVSVLLILGRDGNPMDGALDVVSGEQAERVAGIDSKGRVLGLSHFHSPVEWSLVWRPATG